jgi:hypothetical protein
MIRPNSYATVIHDIMERSAEISDRKKHYSGRERN